MDKMTAILKKFLDSGAKQNECLRRRAELSEKEDEVFDQCSVLSSINTKNDSKITLASMGVVMAYVILFTFLAGMPVIKYLSDLSKFSTGLTVKILSILAVFIFSGLQLGPGILLFRRMYPFFEKYFPTYQTERQVGREEWKELSTQCDALMEEYTQLYKKAHEEFHTEMMALAAEAEVVEIKNNRIVVN